MSDWIQVDAPAKVNLHLDVLGRREDGFHELATALMAVDLSDRLLVRRGVGDGMQLTVDGPAASDDIPTDGRNLVWRAAVATADRIAELGGAELDAPLELHLEKHVPSQAGLGGGSSDAAATVRAVAACLGYDLPPNERLSILGDLGSDTVFFEAAAHTGLAWCLGRGESVHPIETRSPDWSLALVVPAATASTRSVFGALHLEVNESIAPHRPLDDPTDGTLEDVRSSLFNGLEPAACDVEPELARWRAMLDRSGLAHFSLSGSGSAWFGLYPDDREARAALETVQRGAQADGLGLRCSQVVHALGRGVGSPQPVAEGA